MLLTSAQIQAGLAAKYESNLTAFPEAFAPLVPHPPQQEWVNETVKKLEKVSGKTLPSSFTTALHQWNLDSCYIAGIAFSRRGCYVQEIQQFNSPVPLTRWWEDRDCETRPTNQLMIAHGDPFVILLDEVSGHILSYAADEGSFTAQVVAEDLCLFMRGIGTVELISMSDAEVELLLESVLPQLERQPARAFWYEMAHVHRDA